MELVKPTASGTIDAPTRNELVVLHLGCQHKKTPESLGLKMFNAQGAELEVPIRMINLDMNPHVEPDLLCVLGKDPIPLVDDSVDFVVALHVLEHIGDHAGDVAAWFMFWEELYRVMKPGASIQFECPYHSSVWAWADPTHVRAISEYTFLYLNQDSYKVGGAIPDYRPRFDFFIKDQLATIPDHTNPKVAAKEPVSFIRGMLVARKPLQPYWEPAP
jgi:hypothetical protein